MKWNLFVSAQMFKKYGLKIGVVALMAGMTFSEPLLYADGSFGGHEIRVIRPRFMTKRKRFELGTEGIVIMNQTFIYTYLLSGMLTFHLTEEIALELAGAYGLSVDKEDKNTLSKPPLDIQTQILRTQDFFTASLLFTPLYGKYQLASGDLIYFDTFLSVGGGMTGFEYRYEHCPDPNTIPDDNEAKATIPIPPAARSVHYPSFVIGLGQRFFLNEKTSLRWGVRNHAVFYNTADGDCDLENAEAQEETHFNITLQIGASRYF